MSKRELIEKIERAPDMVIAVSGRKFRIHRDEDDGLTIAERCRKETKKHYSDTQGLMSRFKIDGRPLRDWAETITIEKYTALLDA